MEADFSSPESLREAHRLVLGSATEPVGGDHQSACAGNTVPPSSTHLGRRSKPRLRLAQSTFNVVKEFEDDIRRSVAEGGGWLINFTSLNGKFGVDSEVPFPLAQAARWA